MSLNEIVTIGWKLEVIDDEGRDEFDAGPVGLFGPNGKIVWLTDDSEAENPVWMTRLQAEALARAVGVLFKEV